MTEQLEALKAQGVLEATHVRFWDAPRADKILVPGSWKDVHGYYGATRGHLEMLQWLWEQPDFQTALILEDDAEFEPWFADEFPKFMARVPKVAPDWLALWLGGSETRAPSPVDDTVILCNGALQSHAYIVNLHGLWRLYDHLWCEHHKIVDWAYKDLMGSDACIYRPARWLVTTRDSFSDNRQTQAKRGE